MQIYIEYVEEKNAITMIPTYFLLRDCIEMLFGQLRSRNGFNNNPNTQQLKDGYRRIACNIKITALEHGKCRIFSQSLPEIDIYSDIFTVSSKRSRIAFKNIEELYENQKDSILEDVIKIDELIECDSLLDATSNYSIAYLASRIEENLYSRINCESCSKVFDENEKIHEIRTNNSFSPPCQSTFNI